MSIQHDKSSPASDKAQVGQPAPDFTLPSLTGEPVRLASFS